MKQITKDERNFLEKKKGYKMHERLFSTMTKHKKFFVIEDKRSQKDLEEYQKTIMIKTE